MNRLMLFTVFIACCSAQTQNGLRLIQEWSQLDYAFPSEEARQTAIENGDFVPGKPVAIDVQVDHRRDGSSRIFVTSPRFDTGTPITLGTVNEQGQITPYPDYSWHENQGENCDGLTSVFTVAIDTCNRLWVLDTGKLGDSVQRCDPQLLAFNLDNDELIYRHYIESSNYVNNSLFITPVVDVREDCSNTFVYIADVGGFAIVVVDVEEQQSWKVTSDLFTADTEHNNFTIAGQSFTLNYGVFGLALSPIENNERYLYFHALASVTENMVRTSVLRDNARIDNPAIDLSEFYVFPEDRRDQAASEAMDRDGILYFGQNNPPSIWCWNSKTEFSQENFHPIDIDEETLQFASGLKVVNNRLGQQELWVLTSRFQKVMTGSMTTDEINFRIQTEHIPTLLKNSQCATPARKSQNLFSRLLLSWMNGLF